MDQERSTNLCSTYILPLLNLNKYSFGEQTNFVNSYVNDDDALIIVQVTKPVTNVTGHPLFRFNFDKAGHTYYVFELPGKHRETVRKFREGKYSQFPEDAKNQIKKKSGLSYRIPTSTGKLKSAKELLALDKDRNLKEKMEQDLAVKIDDDAELMDIPGGDNFYQLNMAKSTDLVIAQ